MLLWVIRLFVFPPPKTYRTPIDYALLGFFILTGLSALLSYEPMVSIGKLRAASLFTIVYLFAENLHSRRVVRLLAASCVLHDQRHLHCRRTHRWSRSKSPGSQG